LYSNIRSGHLSYVGHSVLGRGVNFGAGTYVANLRHDKAKTGINTSLNVGVRLGVEEMTSPGETLIRDRVSEWLARESASSNAVGGQLGARAF